MPKKSLTEAKQSSWLLNQYKHSQRPYNIQPQLTTLGLLLLLAVSVSEAAARKSATSANATGAKNLPVGESAISSNNSTTPHVPVPSSAAQYGMNAEANQNILFAVNNAQAQVDSNAKPTTKHSFEDKIIVSDAVNAELKPNAVKYYKAKFNKLLKYLHQLSAANRQHIDYALATALKFEFVLEKATNPGHCEYLGVEHKITIPIPNNESATDINIYGIDDFEETIYLRVLHEIQHANTAIMNSKDCHPERQMQQFALGLSKEMPTVLPRNPQEVFQKVAVAQDYILNHVAKILPENGEYIDYKEQYNLEYSTQFFKRKLNKPNTPAGKIELAYLQHLLKDYHPRRGYITLDQKAMNEAIASGKINTLKKGNTVPFPADGYTIYIDKIKKAGNMYLASGYSVKNPKDKVRAFVADTLYQRDRMPKVYEKKFAQSSYPLHIRAAEVDAHSFEVTDLTVYEKIYDEMAATHARTRVNSKCKPGLN